MSQELHGPGKTYKYDMSLPVAEMYGLVEDVRQRLQKYPVRVVGYGHLGDSNVHLNVSTGQHVLWPDLRACACVPAPAMRMHWKALS